MTGSLDKPQPTTTEHGSLVAPKKRVLFVDDDPDVLASFRRLCRHEHQRWDMAFALGGRAALTLLSQGVFDVVVSDMRMPEMTGVALLREVSVQQPGALRILLTGGGDDDAFQDAKLVVDHVLQKPCGFGVLRATIDAMSAPAEVASLHDPGSA